MSTGPLPTIVNTEVEFRLVLAADRSVMVSASLDYAAHEPYSVRVTFRTTDGNVNWVFARDLLADGLRGPAGSGDVTVWPSNNQGRDVMCLSLSSPSGQALLEVERAEIDQFLNRTIEVVPAGSESTLIDMDALIDRLLDDGAPQR